MRKRLLYLALCICAGPAFLTCSTPFRAAGRIIHGFAEAVEIVGDGLEGTAWTVIDLATGAVYGVTVMPVKAVGKAFKGKKNPAKPETPEPSDDTDVGGR